MSYATQAQLVERYGTVRLVELTDRAEPPAGAIDAAVIDRALADADALIDGYVAARYDLPLPAVPDLLRDLALSIAFYKLFLDDAPDKVGEDYREALKTLDRIARGTVRLDVAGDEPAAAEDTIQVTSRDRQFSRDTMGGF